MKSTATAKPLTSCNGGSNSNTSVAPVIAVNSTTEIMAVTIRIAGVDLIYEDAAQAFSEIMTVTLVQQLITNAFRPVFTSVRLLGYKADDSVRRRLLASGDIILDVLAGVSLGKASDAAQFCITASPRMQQDVREQGMLGKAGLWAVCHHRR